MRATLWRVVALCIAITCSTIFMAVILIQGESPGSLVFLVLVFLFLGFIWFPEEIGETTDFFVCNKYVGGTTPWWFVSAAGWFFLLALPVLMVWAWSSSA